MRFFFSVASSRTRKGSQTRATRRSGSVYKWLKASHVIEFVNAPRADRINAAKRQREIGNHSEDDFYSAKPTQRSDARGKRINAEKGEGKQIDSRDEA